MVVELHHGRIDELCEHHRFLRNLQSPHARPLSFPKDGRAFLLTEKNTSQAFVASFSVDNMRNTEANTAVLGFYEALSEQHGCDLLLRVEEHLKNEGIKQLVGPMNQNTWGQYRFALDIEKDDPPFSPHYFFGDVVNHTTYPQHFSQVGFQKIAHYESRASRDLSKRHPRRSEIEANLIQHGIRIENVDMKNFRRILKEIFTLSLEGFSHNKFYAPIDFEYFASLYDGIEAIVDEDLFLLARNNREEVVGFIFAYRDPYGSEMRVILKSMTIDKSVRGIGLGLYLMEEVQRIAHEKNFTMAVHALMYVDNTTKGISEGGMGSVIFRRYALFGKTIL